MSRPSLARRARAFPPPPGTATADAATSPPPPFCERSFQTAYYQRIRPNLWQISWVEETGTSVTITLDIEQKRITTFMAFSKGHWEQPEDAHGDKRDPEALAR